MTGTGVAPSSSTTGATRHQRTASQIATGMRNTVVVNTTQTSTNRAIAPRSGRIRRRASRYAPHALTLRLASISTSAHAVAACTRPSPRSANVVPMTTERKAHAPAASPETLPTESSALSRSHCTKVNTTANGMRRTPRPRKRPGRLTYIRADAEMIWPHERRRAIRSGATGVHVARTVAKIRRPRTTPRKITSGSGLLRSCESALEPFATAEQKKSVVPVPKAPPVGTA